MNKLKVLKLNCFTICILFISNSVFSQNKYVETFNATDEVLVSVNTSYTNIVFETWNKDKVEIEAFVEGEGLSAKEKKEIFDNWNFDVLGNSKKVVITSNAGGNWQGRESLSNLDIIPDLEFLGPLMNEMIMPMISEFNVPALPEGMLQNLGDIQFDYEAFKKDEEGYMKKFEAQIEKNFGKDFELKMEKWGDDFAKEWDKKNGDKLSAEWESKMEAWGENFGKEMEAWGEQMGKDMEKWSKELEQKLEDEGGNYTKQVITDPNGNTKTYIIKENSGNFKVNKATKTIIIRMPKNAKTEINVRHGEIKMADVFNVKATLNHSPFTAKSIDGRETLINASYAPVLVEDWKYGTLLVKFVEDCKVSNVESINLQANSSDVYIGYINKEAMLGGSFGNLFIENISEGFETLDILLENTDAVIKLPNSSFSFYYNGKKSTLKYPKSLDLNVTKNYDRVLVKGFNKLKNLNKNISINATYSNLVFQ
jgi:hypothetical protein